MFNLEDMRDSLPMLILNDLVESIRCLASKEMTR